MAIQWTNRSRDDGDDALIHLTVAYRIEAGGVQWAWTTKINGRVIGTDTAVSRAAARQAALDCLATLVVESDDSVGADQPAQRPEHRSYPIVDSDGLA